MRLAHGVFFCLLLLAAATAPGAETNLGASVESLLDYARQHNPEYAAMRLEAEAAGERITQAAALPDPVLRTEWQNAGNAGSDASPNLLPSRVGSTKYTLMQTLPFFGKRSLKREAAEAETDVAQAQASVSWNELAGRIKAAFIDYQSVAQLIGITREVIGLLDAMERISQVRYASGLVPQQDAIRAQVERTAMKNELINFETEHHHAVLRLNALLAREPHAELAPPSKLRAIPAQLDYALLSEKLREKNPQLFANEAKIRAAEKNRDLAWRNRYPDFTVGVAPIQMRNRVAEWELMVEFNIPLQQGSRRAQEREAERTLAAARARRQASVNQLTADLGENLAAIDAARRVEILAKTSLLPQAELTFQAALAGYENGKVDFATLLDAQRQIRLAKQNIIKAQAEQQTRLADVERLIGEDL